MTSSVPRTLVIDYGTLKRGGNKHDLLADQQYLGEALTPAGFRLIDLGEYPGMVRSAADQSGVAGEVWSVTPIALAQLDALEGTADGLYRRELIALLPPFDGQPVETYFYNRDVTGRPEITGGIWIER
jgi:gamma-glutamylaminecyclotransferase